MRGCSGGACMVAPGGHAWFYFGGWEGFVCGFIREACVVLFGGACMVLFGGVCVVLFWGHAWFYLGGVRGFIQGHAWFYSGGMRGFIQGGHVWFFQFFQIQ